MLEIRIHGRGGQGAVIAAELLASAFFKEGKYVQAFPSFGPERRSAPVQAFVRVDDAPIRLRCDIYRPDHLLVLDAALVHAVDVTSGLKDGGWILINSNKSPESFGFPGQFRVATVDASAIAVKHRLGSSTSPIVNTVLLGAFARVTGLVGIEAVVAAIDEGAPVNKEANIAAARESYEKA